MLRAQGNIPTGQGKEQGKGESGVGISSFFFSVSQLFIISSIFFQFPGFIQVLDYEALELLPFSGLSCVHFGYFRS